MAQRSSHVNRGESAEREHQSARREFGTVTCPEGQLADQWCTRWLENFCKITLRRRMLPQEIRLRTNRYLTLALGIGAKHRHFSVV